MMLTWLTQLVEHMKNTMICFKFKLGARIFFAILKILNGNANFKFVLRNKMDNEFRLLLTYWIKIRFFALRQVRLSLHLEPVECFYLSYIYHMTVI